MNAALKGKQISMDTVILYNVSDSTRIAVRADKSLNIIWE